MSDEEKREELSRKREEIQKRRRERAAAEALAREEQELADLEIIDALEEEHGDSRVSAAPVRGWIPNRGAVARVAVVAPCRSDSTYQRWQQLIMKHRENPSGQTAATEQLGRMALKHPHPTDNAEAFKATLELCPMLLRDAADMAIELAGADIEADAKKLRS